MKISRLFLSLAICGAGAIPTNAQNSHVGNGRTSSIVLTSQYDDLSFDEAEVAEDFLFEEPAQPAIEVPSIADELEAPSPSDAIPTGKSVLDHRPIAPEPQSLPIETPQHVHSGHGASASILAGVTHVNSGPVMWDADSQQHSPVARVLLRSDCNASQLWNGYPAERSQECAKMWNCLNKNCGASCGCSHCVHPSVVSAQPHSRILNRYRNPSRSTCDGCDSCGSGLAATPTSGAVAKTVAVRGPGTVPIQQARAPEIQSLPAPPQAPSQVTSRPKYNTASTQYRAMR